jgi:cyclopropane-fatty-acyl-phospholipid synthase
MGKVMTKPRDFFAALLGQADIHLEGERPHDVIINDERVFDRVLKHHALGLGEAYMEGWWDCEQLDEFFHRLLAARVDKKLLAFLTENKRYLMFACKHLIKQLAARLINQQKRRNAFKIAEVHYDIGNPLFAKMLDSRLNYTCGYWRDAKNLEDAQLAKLDLVCRKLKLKAGDKLLDIGCGWGSLARYAAENYGVSVVGVTVSKEQQQWATEMTRHLPVTIKLMDYRDLAGEFDAVASLGMFEHVGYKNYNIYMKKAYECLKQQGLFLLHTIGANTTSFEVNPWIKKYIFPQGMIPSIQQVGRTIEPYFVMEDWHNFGADYDKTLLAWYHNFHKNWSHLQTHYDGRFYRMWRYYLLSCAGAFRARELQLWQVVLSKAGVQGGYASIR